MILHRNLLRLNVQNRKRSALTYSLGFLFMLVVALIMACGEDAMNEPIMEPDPEPEPKTESDYYAVLDSLGGDNNVLDLSDVQIRIRGNSYEYEEEEPSQDNPILVRSYNVTRTAGFANLTLRLDFSNIESHYPLSYNSQSATLIINQMNGSKSGQYDVTSSYFGQIQPTELFSNRIMAELKNYSMSNPIELLRQIQPDVGMESFSTIDNKFHISTMIQGLDILLEVDKENDLPKRSMIYETDYLHGDVLFEVIYKSWKVFDGILYPSELEYRYNDQVIREEEIISVEFDPDLNEDIYLPEVEEFLIPYSEDLAKDGLYRSQWFMRFWDLGLSIDLPIPDAFVADANWIQFGLPDQTISNDIKIIGRPDIQYWSVGIRTGEGILLIDAPVHNQYCRAIINAAIGFNTGPPNSEIIAGVVVTHDHVDHFSGIREMASEADKIYINTTGSSELEEILEAPHTLLPDALSSRTNLPEIIEVDNILKLDSGRVEIHALQMVDDSSNPHSENMLMVYVPEEQLIIQADLFNAGALLAVYEGKTAIPMSEETKRIWRDRARFLLNYINENDLEVTRIVGMHGGLSSLDVLRFVAS